MKFDISAVRKCLKSFDFPTLFREHLGWDNHQARLDIPVGDGTVQLTAVAQKRGFVAYVCSCGADGQPCEVRESAAEDGAAPIGQIPDRATRLKIDQQVTKSAREHFVIYADQRTGQQVWHWVRREPGRPSASRDHRFDVSQSGTPLIQRLEQIAVGMAEEEQLTLFEVTGKAKKAFDVDRVTKRFYERFKAEHAAFLKFVKGIRSEGDLQWYTSLMLNRLMFVYFIQKKGFLDGDTDYLRNRMRLVREAKGRDKFLTFYRYFLLRLFHEGLGKHENERQLDKELENLLGKVPFLNGGFFEVHQLEERNPEIDIPDKAFEKLFDFFDDFRWHLDERPLRADNEINPDVVGYIFEKYINQKQMGAYYTKEDITEYISKNTIIPFVFDAAEKKCPIAFAVPSPSPLSGEGRGEGLPAIWRLLRDDPDRYIYPAVRHGVIYEAPSPSQGYRRGEDGDVLPLPPAIAAGLIDVSKRGAWNQPASDLYGLPTETWREHVARRNRCLELRRKLKSGEVHTINELVTLNLDIWQFARDAIVHSEGPELLRAFWHAIQKITVLDPTCGSGAFLFAALRILESLYSDCLERMQRFVEELDENVRSPSQGKGRAERRPLEKLRDFKAVLARLADHPNERYFVLKSIIIDNLFGVDIMEEAVEICKLRLFLKLVAQVETADQIEPLPDIDFNIRAGNTLVGYVSLDEVRKARETEQRGNAKQKLMLDSDAKAEIRRIEEDALVVEKCFEQFRAQQTKHGGKVTAKDKQELRQRLEKLDGELDRYLAGEYGIAAEKFKTKAAFEKAFVNWKTSHEPFHWLVEFYGIMADGGFDVIIGNPPYVAVSKVNYLATTAKAIKLPDLYAHVLLRSFHVANASSRFGMIVPLSVTFSEDFGALRSVLTDAGNAWFSSFDNIPAALFAGVSQRCTIWIGDRSRPRVFVTPMYRWRSSTRIQLFPKIAYVEATPLVKSENGIPKIATHRLRDVLARTGDVNGGLREVLANSRSAKYRLGFSPSARNFVSVFRDPPPCLDDSTLRAVESSDQASLGLSDSKDISAAVIAVAGECFFHHWLTWGDGFHVTNGNIASFVRLLDHMPERHLNLLRSLGECLLARRNEALAFKRNAGKYIGNFNYRGHAWLTRRADLVLMAGLEMNADYALELFGYVQRVLAINEFAGEKAIPDAVKLKYRAGCPDESFECSVLDAADQLILDHFHFAPSELKFLLNLDVLFRTSNENG
jgi:hypothetical protein